MKGPIQVKCGLSLLPTLQYSSTPSFQIRNCPSDSHPSGGFPVCPSDSHPSGCPPIGIWLASSYGWPEKQFLCYVTECICIESGSRWIVVEVTTFSLLLTNREPLRAVIDSPDKLHASTARREEFVWHTKIFFIFSKTWAKIPHA